MASFHLPRMVDIANKPLGNRGNKPSISSVFPRLNSLCYSTGLAYRAAASLIIEPQHCVRERVCAKRRVSEC